MLNDDKYEFKIQAYGFGRMLEIKSGNLWLVEGLFREGKLDGFGRKTLLSSDPNEKQEIIGWFKEGKRHGYIKQKTN